MVNKMKEIGAIMKMFLEKSSFLIQIDRKLAFKKKRVFYIDKKYYNYSNQEEENSKKNASKKL